MIRRHHDDAWAFEEAWAGRTPRDTDIAALVACAEQICAAAAVEPSADFRSSLRERLMTEAATVLVTSPPATRTAPSPATTIRPIRRRLAGVTAAVIGAVSVVSLVGSSASALPGDMLYPVKRSVENVELAMHRSDASRGQFRLEQASERLAEARQLTGQSSPADQRRVSGALNEFTDQADDGSTALFADYDSRRSESSITTVNDFTAAAATDLAALSRQLPAAASDAFDAATATVSDLAVRSAAMCSSCGTADVSTLVNAVTSLGARSALDPPREALKQSQPVKASATTGTTSPALSAPTPLPTVTVPSLPKATSDPVGTLNSVTKPVVGALLGDDEQRGVVPGLLDGLLGKK